MERQPPAALKLINEYIDRVLAFPFDPKDGNLVEGIEHILDWIQTEIPELTEINREGMGIYWQCLLTNQVGSTGPRLLQLIPREEWRSDGAYFWDSLIEESPEWNHVEYSWIANSCYGDQAILTKSSPLHEGPAIYIHGPDIHGPVNEVHGWIENIIYLASSYEVWMERVEMYGDEHAIGPGGIDRELGERADEYRKIYRKLNPGLRW